MKNQTFCVLGLGLIIAAGSIAACSKQNSADSVRSAKQDAVAETQMKKEDLDATETYGQEPQRASLQEADKSSTIVGTLDRKIISSAELTLEVAIPVEIQRRISSIAASYGGYVVTSESRQKERPEQSQPQLETSLVVRVPASNFDAAVGQIRSAGNRVVAEKLSGQDVTEDFIDLEARLKSQKALEIQFLEIMKQARKVGDALEVQRQIGEVRTEIERLEGRKRFLENRASLSTITVSLRTPVMIAVNTSSFGRSVKEAVGTSVDLAAGIVLALIRFIIVMVPITLFIILPAAFLVRYFQRRARRLQLAHELESVAPAK